MTYIRKIIIIFLFLIPVIVVANDEEPGVPKIRGVVKPKEATIGDKLTYRVNIAGKNIKKIKVLLPQKKMAFLSDIEPDEKTESKDVNNTKDEKEDEAAASIPVYIIHSAKKDDRSEKSVTDMTVILEMSYYRPGKHRLPQIDIIDVDNIKIGYNIPEINIKALNKKGEFSDVEPPLPLGGNFTRLVILLVCAIILGIIGYFAFQYFRKKIKELREEIIIIPPIITFRSDMENFHGDALIQEGKIEEYVFGISKIFRTFLSGQLKFDATEMTSDEILKQLKKHLEKDDYKKYHIDIDKSFQLWDLSKFAEFAPSQEILLANLESTVKLVENMAEEEEDVTPGV